MSSTLFTTPSVPTRGGADGEAGGRPAIPQRVAGGPGLADPSAQSEVPTAEPTPVHRDGPGSLDAGVEAGLSEQYGAPELCVDDRWWQLGSNARPVLDCLQVCCDCGLAHRIEVDAKRERIRFLLLTAAQQEEVFTHYKDVVGSEPPLRARLSAQDERVKQAVAIERERCALIAEDDANLDSRGGSTGNAYGTANRIARAIRDAAAADSGRDS